MSILPGPVSLARGAAVDLWRWKKPLSMVVGVVALPVALASTWALDADPTVAAYAAFASLFMNVALLWMALRLKGGKAVTVKQAYYQGTAMTLRFILLAVLYLLMALPFLLGLTLYVSAVSGEGAASGLVENLFVAGLWLLLSWPTFYWLSRGIFGIFELDNGRGPIESVRSSRSLTRGRAGAVFGRLVVLGAVMLIGISLPSFVAYTSVPDDWLSPILVAIQAIGTFVFLPLSYLYLFRLYVALGEGAQ